MADGGFPQFKLCNRLRATVLLVGCVCLCTGFSFPSPQEVKDGVQTELEKIKEMTPGAREEARWESARQEAEAALLNAQSQSAPRYAREAWAESQELMAQAEEYARNGSFHKAAYLARQVAAVAQEAQRQAEATRQEKIKQARLTLESLKTGLDAVGDQKEADSGGLSSRFDELFLEWQDLVHALALEQFEDIAARGPTLQEKINALQEEFTRRGRR